MKVPNEHPRVRLEQFLLQHMDAFPTKNSARKAAKRGQVLVDGETMHPSAFVTPGMEIVYHPPPPREVYEMDLDVVYEDDHLAVIHKPAGIATTGHRRRNIRNALPGNLAPCDAPDALPAPHPAHRLDAKTRGLLLCGKTRTALAGLGQAFQERRIHKRYRALLVGRLEGEGTVDAPIDDREAQTRYVVVGHTRSLHCDWLTRVDLFPETGRTHQLRRHMASLGHPVLGERQYGADNLKGKGLFLQAAALELEHPVTGEALTIEIPEPPKFTTFTEREQRRWDRWHTD